MNHGKKNRKFGRDLNQRRALMRSLALSLIEHESITTTEAKAKELRSYIEKIITRAANDTVANRRVVSSRLGGSQDKAVQKLFTDLGKRYEKRAGGYTRVVKLPPRQGDASPMAVIQLV